MILAPTDFIAVLAYGMASAIPSMMDHGLVAQVAHLDAGALKIIGVRFALVAQRVEASSVNMRRRQPRQVSSPQWGKAWIFNV